ncbi:MAG: 5'(3')-deoxyribonucleotidase, partial [Chitinophagaceae bacterium]
MKRIIIDMDEVIADPMGAMIDWYTKHYTADINYEKMLAGSWVLGFPEEHQKLVMDKIHAPGFFRHLPVMDDAVRVLAGMNKKYEIFIVSAAMEFPNSLIEKYDWLMEHFPYFT